MTGIGVARGPIATAIVAGLLAIGLGIGAQAATPSPLDTILGATAAMPSRNFTAKNGVITQWKRMMDRFQEQQAKCEPAAGCARFKALAASLAGLSVKDQFAAIHRAYATIPYVPDQKLYGVADFWATPYELLQHKAGDAEDYAILGYYLLRSAGMPADALRVVAVRLKRAAVGHAVLAVDQPKGPMIIDILSTHTLPAEAEAPMMSPVIGVNETAWWVYLPR